MLSKKSANVAPLSKIGKHKSSKYMQIVDAYIFLLKKILDGQNVSHLCYDVLPPMKNRRTTRFIKICCGLGVISIFDQFGLFFPRERCSFDYSIWIISLFWRSSMLDTRILWCSVNFITEEIHILCRSGWTILTGKLFLFSTTIILYWFYWINVI